MRISKLFTKTSKSIPADETAKNAQLLMRAGYVHKEMAGVYAYLPLGFKVIENIKNIVREEMNAVDGQEVMMTTLQPKDIWEKTDRWDDKKVDNWFKTRLINGTELGVGLTHEEPIVDAIGNYVKSYKDLPITVYQIQSKFRNELRAKSGLLRGREFIMKDMYSFARDQKEHDQIYERILGAYRKVFDRIGLGDITYRTYADGGIFTSKFSDEWQTLCDNGEDIIYLDEEKKIAINEEIMTDENLEKLGLNRDKLVKKRSSEAGNTFHLESKYTDALDVYYTDPAGQKRSIIMGCYGIGVSRLLGLIAEVFADDRGLVWPENIAPFKVYLARLGSEKKVIDEADGLYDELTTRGVEVIYDDRDARAGEKLADSELLGIPYRVVISSHTVEKNIYEITERKSQAKTMLTRDKLLAKLV